MTRFVRRSVLASAAVTLGSRVMRPIPLTDTGSPTVDAPFADLGGYLLARRRPCWQRSTGPPDARTLDLHPAVTRPQIG